MSTKSIEIFAAGRHTAMDGRAYEFSEADLAGAAATYDPARHEAPIVVGHPRHDAPAYGWVAGLKTEGGRLIADVDQLDPSFAELLRDGRYKKVSASFYLPDAPGNPTPGKLYLRHVGFLGAQPPAVKGLRQAAFGDGDEGVAAFGDWDDRAVARLLRSLREWIIGKFGAADADQALSGWDLNMVQEAVADTRPDSRPAFAEAEAREAALAQREAALAQREQDLAEAQTASFVEGLVAAGQVLPAERERVVAILHSLAGGGSASFAEGDAAAALRGFLSALPVRVPQGEVATGDTVDFADADSIAQAAERYQAEQAAKGIAVSFAAAVTAITKGKGA